MLIYKVFRAGEWAELEATGETRGAPVDLADGYVHFSTAAQLGETLRRHFRGERDLWLLAVDADAAGRRDALGALARRRALPPPLPSAPPGGRALGAADRGRRRRGRSRPRGCA